MNRQKESANRRRQGSRSSCQGHGTDYKCSPRRQNPLARQHRLRKTKMHGKQYQMLQLLTSKPVLYVCNVDEDSAAAGNEFSQKVFAKAEKENAKAVVISAAIESEVAQLDNEEEKKEFLSALGLEETGLTKSLKPDTNFLDWKLILPQVPKKFGPGLSLKAPKHRNAPELFIPTLSGVLFVPKLSLMTTILNLAANKAARKPERCVPKEGLCSQRRRLAQLSVQRIRMKNILKYHLYIIGFAILTAAAVWLNWDCPPNYDEAHAWNIARHLSTAEIFTVSKTEGHPFLWYYLLMPLAKANLLYPYSLYFLNLLLVIGAFLPAIPICAVSRVRQISHYAFGTFSPIICSFARQLYALRFPAFLFA